MTTIDLIVTVITGKEDIASSEAVVSLNDDVVTGASVDIFGAGRIV